MLKLSPAIAFVPSTDLGRARRFYGDVLGLTGGGLVAWFADPDGNTVSLTQFVGSPRSPHPT